MADRPSSSIIARCHKVLAEIGPDARVQLVVRRRRVRGQWCRLWRGGPVGKYVGALGNGKWMVDVVAAEFLAALEPTR